MFANMVKKFQSLYPPVHEAPDAVIPRQLRPFFLYFVRQFSKPLIIFAIVIGLIAAVDLALPILVGEIIDRILDTPKQLFFTQHWMFLVLVLLAILARPVLALFDEVIQHFVISPSLIDRVRWQSHKRLSQQSWRFFLDRQAGSLASKIVSSGTAVESTVMGVLDAFLYTIILALLTLVYLSTVSWQLLLVILAWLILYGWLLVHFIPKIQAQSEKVADAESVLTGRVVDQYVNVHTLKLFPDQQRQDAHVAEGVNQHLQQNQSLYVRFFGLWLSLNVLNAFLIFGVGLLALILWQNDQITPGDIAAVLPVILQLVLLSAIITDIASTVFVEVGDAEDSMHLVTTPIDLVDHENAKPLKLTRGEIVFDNVHFDFAPTKSNGSRQGSQNTPHIIDGFNLTIQPGEKVGLVGRSGAGKSTLISLLLRLYDVNEGAIKIDGQRTDAVTQNSLRAQIGVVAQDPSLLHRSIEDNLRIAAPDASDEALIAACQKAAIHDVISGLSDSEGRSAYKAHVGERGVKLSGGQRQRLALARIMLKNAPILVLDEATSALDSEVEAFIQTQLDALMGDKTVLAIAHRLSTIARMDRLIVMDKGRIVEEGTHDQLVAKNGLYAQLWARQSGGFINQESSS